MIDPPRLAAVPVGLLDGAIDVPADYSLAALHGEGLVTLLCAVVTRSGWDW